MKIISILICILCMNTAIYAQYISSTVEQVSSPTVAPGSLNNPIIRIKIDVGAIPIDLYALFLTTAGSTNPSTDIDSIKIFYTGNSNIFLTTTPYMGGTFPLPSGINYFWVAYDISIGAIVCDTIDAECYTVYVSGGTQTPSVTAPVGYAVVGNCVTGINTLDFLNPQIKIYPNPSSENITVILNGISENQKIQFYNSIGILLQETSINQTTQINISDLPSGLYFVHLKNQVSQTQKFIKQ